MGMLGRIGSFIVGGLLGAGVGAVVGMLAAPQSGAKFRGDLERRVDQVKVAGLEAQVRAEEEMIRRFRAETGDPTALRDEETQIRIEAAQAIADLGVSPTGASAADTANTRHNHNVSRSWTCAFRVRR